MTQNGQGVDCTRSYIIYKGKNTRNKNVKIYHTGPGVSHYHFSLHFHGKIGLKIEKNKRLIKRRKNWLFRLLKTMILKTLLCLERQNCHI